MKTKDEIIAILRNFKEEFGERYGIEKLGLKESLEERFNAKVDVVSLTAIMRSLFRNHIEKDAIYI